MNVVNNITIGVDVIVLTIFLVRLSGIHTFKVIITTSLKYNIVL